MRQTPGNEEKGRRHASEAQREASRVNGAKSGGPRTKAGRRRSALNAVRHGLEGRALLLPGERLEDVQRRYEQIRAALPPSSEIEEVIEMEMADTGFKLFDRLRRAEHQREVARLQEKLSATPAYQKRVGIRRARIAMGSLVDACIGAATTNVTKSRAASLVAGAEGTVALAREVEEMDGPLVAALEAEIRALKRLAPEAVIDAKPLEERAVALKNLLDVLAAQVDQEVEQERERIASSEVLMTPEDLRGFDRYRNSLARDFLRQLENLKALREEQDARKNRRSSGSFRPGRSMPLKVVK